MLEVVIERLGENQDVIQVHRHEVWSLIWVEAHQYTLHEALKDGRGIFEPKRHHVELIQPLVGDERCLLA